MNEKTGNPLPGDEGNRYRSTHRKSGEPGEDSELGDIGPNVEDQSKPIDSDKSNDEVENLRLESEFSENDDSGKQDHKSQRRRRSSRSSESSNSSKSKSSKSRRKSSRSGSSRTRSSQSGSDESRSKRRHRSSSSGSSRSRSSGSGSFGTFSEYEEWTEDSSDLSSHGEEKAAKKSLKKAAIQNANHRVAPTFLVWLGRAILLSIILIAPWWLGSVHKPAQFTLSCLALAGLVVWWIELAITRKTKTAVPILAIVVGIGLLIGVMQIIPLPDQVADVVAPKQAKILNELGTPVEGEAPNAATDFLRQLKPATTLSMNREGSIDYINLIVLGLICLLLANHYFNSRQSVNWLITILVVQGTALSLFAIVQRMNFNGRLYWVLDKFDGKPFGPFINRNNAGGYLLLCLAGSLGFAYLAFTQHEKNQRPRPLIGNDYPILKRLQLRISLFLAELTPGKIASLVTTILIFSAVVVSLSRGATVALIVASVLTMWFVGFAKFPKATLLFSLSTFVLTFALIGWLGYGDQLTSRFESMNSQEELMVESRFKLWQDALEIVPDYPVLGCGLNAFKDVFRSYRESRESVYFEYAENTYVQTLIELGIVGFLLLLAAIVLMIFSVHKLLAVGNSRKTAAAATIGVFALVSQMTASLFDFGLYIPAVTVLMAVICGFIAGQTQSLAERTKKKWPTTFKAPAWIFHVAILLLFSGGVLVCMDLYGKAQVSSVIKQSPLGYTHEDLTLENCEFQIKQLESKIEFASGSLAHKRLGELNLHRSRLLILERQKNAVRFDRIPEDRQGAVLDSLWDQSSLLTMHRQMSLTRRSGDQRQIHMLLNDPIIVEHMPKVRANMLAARYYMPLDPGIHLMLAQCQVFSSAPEFETIHLDRAKSITPNNAAVIFTTGILHLQSGRSEPGKTDLRKCLSLDSTMMPQVTVFALASGLTKQEIIEGILPTEKNIARARLLLKFAVDYLTDESEQSLKSDVLDQADGVIANVTDPDRTVLALHADIKIEQNELDEAIAIKKRLVLLDPLNEKLHRSLLVLYERTEQWENAIEECSWLSKHSRNVNHYNRRLRDLRSQLDSKGLQ